MNAVDASSSNELWSVGSYYDNNFTERTLAVQSPSLTQGALVGNVGYYGAVISWFGPENDSTIADVHGNYQAAALPAGSYTLTVNAGGCTPEATNITIAPGETQVQNVHLQCQ